MSSYVTRKTPGDNAWFTHDRFGMFIHWGLYSMPACHEWVKSHECLSEEKYDTFLRHFDPDMFDPREWARAAKAAGMKYAVLTAKHHEGFCMFDSAYTDYKITNTACGRDVVGEFAEAFRAEGLRVGLYYSLIDWHHPDFPIDMIHPRRNEPDAEEMNKSRDMRRYAQYMRDQVRELLTKYGKIDIMWFDYSYPNARDDEHPWMRGKGKDDWESEELIAMIRSINPDILINNRCGIDQDVWTPEQFQLTEWLKDEKTGELLPWEACHTLCSSWGYAAQEVKHKSPDMLIRLLINSVALGGNLLLNVGPTSRGYLDSHAMKALDTYAEWMKYHARSIYGCTMAEPELYPLCPPDCRFTQSEDGKRLYIHIFAYPYAHIQIKGLAGKVDYSQFLHDGSEVPFVESHFEHISIGADVDESTVTFYLPKLKPDVIVPVIEVFLK